MISYVIIVSSGSFGIEFNRFFLADTDHSDYLIGQLQDIQDVCSTQLPEVTIRNIGPYQTATIMTMTSTSSASAAATTCAGQTVSIGSGCNSLSSTYGVTTGDLQALTGDSSCQITSDVCLPLSCTLELISTAQTCTTMATALNITSVQFLSWNRNVIGLCDSLTTGQYVCGR